MRSRRVVVSRFGDPEVLELISADVASPGKREVRLRVLAAGVAYGDVMRRRGVLAPRPPFTPGYDVVGVVEELGAEVGGLERGQRVVAMTAKTGRGGYSEALCVPARQVAQVPDGVSTADALCLGLNSITAYQILHRVAKARSGQSILIHGAAGGVGSALLDLGQELGLRMIGTASLRKHGLLQERGAVAIDYREKDFVEEVRARYPEGVDCVIDPIGGKHLVRSCAAARKSGIVVAMGISGDVAGGYRAVLRGAGTYLALKLRPGGPRMRIYAINATPGTGPAQCRDDWQTLLGWRAAGRLHPVLGAELPLEQAAQAHALLEQAAVLGKILLRCSEG